ncbi:MAG: heme-binding domain-containing protein [Bacteroidia bacterium]|nr:heme-binding domain-containing protein [Bacteroidia bacterium]
MRFAKKILLSSGILFIAIQFIRPVQNKNRQVQTTDISKVITIPDSVQILLKHACYDCHSNNSDYPWYSNIQPLGWVIANDIKKAKNQLNFSEFGSYSKRRQLSKLDGIANSIKDDIMPLKSYKLIHKSAKLSTNEKSHLIRWALQSKDSLSTKQATHHN